VGAVLALSRPWRGRPPSRAAGHDAVLDRQDFGHHADGDLGRCLAADVNADRAAQARQRGLGLLEVLDHALAARLVVAP
jgi:hypothetical protein